MSSRSALQLKFAIPSSRRWVYASVLLVAIAYLAIPLLMDIPSVAYQLKLSTTELPQHNTVLYFDNPSKLPARAVAGKLINIDYHIDNQENITTKYRVSVDLVTDGHSKGLDEKTFTLPENAAVDLPVQFTPAPNTNYELIISLPLQNEQIYFRCAS
jgi:hypothetical protein